MFRFTKLKIADQTVGPECNKSWLVFMNEIGGGFVSVLLYLSGSYCVAKFGLAVLC